jgi:hypothetical protein
MSRRYKPYLEERIQPDGTIVTTELPWKARFEYKDKPPEDKTPVVYGCAQLGPHRYGWLVTDLKIWFTDNPPNAFGYAPTREEAEQKLTEARKAYAGSVCYRRVGLVRMWNSELAKRNRKPNDKVKDSQPVEYIWTDWWDNEDCKRRWEQVPIVKKTAKRIFVPRQHVGEECYTIDRQEFEQNGQASTGTGWGRQTYYAQPEQREGVVPECLRVFGLNANATAAQVKRAFRQRVKTAHPDQGGDAEGFRQLRESFEEALRVVGAAA